MSTAADPLSPIGLFDSGVGGLSILREVAVQLPCEHLLYYADQAHCPYGSRSIRDIQGLSSSIVQFLLAHGAKCVVVACNTASAAALAYLRNSFPNIPFVGMVPAVKPASGLTKQGIIGVLATAATFQGRLFADVVNRFAGDVQIITQVCPDWVELVESGQLSGPRVESAVRTCLEPLLVAGVDTLVLGCTHYPFLVPVIRDIVGDAVTIVDPAPAVARQVRRVLESKGLLNQALDRGTVRLFTSGDPVVLARQFTMLLGHRYLVTTVQGIKTDG